MEDTKDLVQLWLYSLSFRIEETYTVLLLNLKGISQAEEERRVWEMAGAKGITSLMAQLPAV
jgi:hypothetical protein